MAMSRPRTRRSSEGESVRRSRLSNAMRPVTVAALPSRPRTARAVTDLPDPDSPTRPRDSPSPIASERPRTAGALPKRMFRVSICSRGTRQSTGNSEQNLANQTAQNNERSEPQLASLLAWMIPELLLRRRDCVLGGLRDAELHDGLGLDLDLFAGLRVAAHAGLALCLHEAAEARNHEYAVLLGFLDRGVREQIQESSGLLVCELGLLCESTDQSGFGHCCCHRDFLLCVAYPERSKRSAVDTSGSKLRQTTEQPVMTRVRKNLPPLTLRLSKTIVNGKRPVCTGFFRFFLVFLWKTRKFGLCGALKSPGTAVFAVFLPHAGT